MKEKSLHNAWVLAAILFVAFNLRSQHCVAHRGDALHLALSDRPRSRNVLEAVVGSQDLLVMVRRPSHVPEFPPPKVLVVEIGPFTHETRFDLRLGFNWILKIRDPEESDWFSLDIAHRVEVPGDATRRIH